MLELATTGRLVHVWCNFPAGSRKKYDHQCFILRTCYRLPNVRFGSQELKVQI